MQLRHATTSHVHMSPVHILQLHGHIYETFESHQQHRNAECHIIHHHVMMCLFSLVNQNILKFLLFLISCQRIYSSESRIQEGIPKCSKPTKVFSCFSNLSHSPTNILFDSLIIVLPAVGLGLGQELNEKHQMMRNHT